VVMDKREGNIALLKGKTIVPLHSKTSNVPGKTRAGGQSSVRFARLREGAAKEFMGKLGEMMKAEFLDKKDLKGIIVGGPGQTKYEFVDGNFITDQVKRKIISIKDLSYTGEFGLQELVDKAQDVLANEEIAEEKKIVQDFLTKLAKQPGYVNYGEAAVFEDLQAGIVDTVLISEIVPDETIQKFEEVAQKFGTKIALISVETREGVQLKEMGRIACILRYEVQR
jgi:peptide chain release factor subunit 1